MAEVIEISNHNLTQGPTFYVVYRNTWLDDHVDREKILKELTEAYKNIIDKYNPHKKS